MILRRPYTLPSALLYLLLLTTRFAYAEEDSPFDCRVAVEGVKFDLTSLAGEHTASQKRKTPPTTTLDLVRFDLCAELRKQEDVAEGDQCASGTRACLTQVNSKTDEKDRIISVIPLMSASLNDLTFNVGASSPKYITLNSIGPEYPHHSNSTLIHQSLSLTILCSTRETPEPVFKSYDGATVVIEWSAPAGCPVEGGNNGGDDKDGGNYDSKPPEDDKNESAGSGIGWFFLVLLLAFVAYFGLGAYYNYSTYGARGADLILHRDFWKEVPYMLSDVVSHLCSSVRPRRSANHGYMAV